MNYNGNNSISDMQQAFKVIRVYKAPRGMLYTFGRFFCVLAVFRPCFIRVIHFSPQNYFMIFANHKTPSGIMPPGVFLYRFILWGSGGTYPIFRVFGPFR